MKNLLLIFISVAVFGFMSVAQPAANSLLPKVDERIELLSIAYKLVNGSNINDTLNPKYSTAISKHFSQYSAHPFVKYIKQIADSLAKDSIDIGSWEIPSLAVHLSQPPQLNPLVPYNDTAYIDGWDNRTLLTEKFVSLLKQFYNDAECEAFFKSQEPYYALINKQLEKQAIKPNRKWVENFFCLQTSEKYYAVISLQNLGVWDYIRINFSGNRRNTYTIFGCDAFDENGVPANFANPMFARSNLHEYIHAFTNQLIDKNISALQTPAETILSTPKIWERVKGTFYNNWQFILYESLVRACSIKYMMENKEIETSAEKEIAAQEKAGFLWMRGLVQQLDIYESNRKKYKNLETFMPEIIKYFTKVAAEIKENDY
jgi:Domain of unknown function (DUF4932)